MTDVSSNQGALAVVSIVLALVFFFAPVIVAQARRTSTLTMISVLLCIVAFLGTPVIIALTPFLGIALGPMFFGICWTAAMICGAAAFIANLIEKRADEFTYRMLWNEVEGLPVPPAMKHLHENKGRR